MHGAFDVKPRRRSQPSSYALSPRVLRRRYLVLLFVAGLLFIAKHLISSVLPETRCKSATDSGLSNQSKQKPSHAQTAEAPTDGASPECANFPDTSRVLLVMKTGASEAYSRIPTQVMTNLKCLPEYLVFGDMAQNVAGYTIHDSLDTVLPQVKLHKDFELYHRQQRCPVEYSACNKHYDAGKEGWNLDKYKNIHMAEKTYTMRPDYDWYLFVDADTYVVWPNLMNWLQRLDQEQLHYIGNLYYVGKHSFGQGGSGYLVSRALMKKFLSQPGVGNRWDEQATHEAFGDFLFAQALRTELKIFVQNAWPTINSENPHTLSYSEKQWCQPSVTMHHVDPQLVSDMYAFERERNFSHPLRIKDIYHRFVKDQLLTAPTREDWDNLSSDVFYLNSTASNYAAEEIDRAKKEDLSPLEKVAHRSFEDCTRVCQSLDKCLQFRFQNGICAISNSIKHGNPTKPAEEERLQYKSGWNVERIQKWTQAHDDCEEVRYPIEDKKPSGH